MAIKTDGSLWAWGANKSSSDNHSRFGNGTDEDSYIPIRIGSDTWADIAVEMRHAAGIKTDGSLWTWGRNDDGQLGDGTTENRSTPVRVGSDSNWASVTVNYGVGGFTIALKTDGTLWAWGNNTNRQLANDWTTWSEIPNQIGNDTDWASVSAGGGFVVALKKDGSLWGWGSNRTGLLSSSGSADRIFSEPTQIGSDTNWANVSSSEESFVLALKTDGSLWAWGSNTNGQLGDGTKENSRTPVRIESDADWASVSAGGQHSVATKKDGSVWAWGNSTLGSLGDGTNLGSNSPIKIDF
jgi:alpha-tubulin suppressor-like RCC1 family protein